jgi:hypothetical protein
MLLTEHDTPAIPSHSTFTTSVNDQMSIAQANETFKVKAKDGHTVGTKGETLAFGKHQLSTAYDKVSTLEQELAVHEKAAAEALASGAASTDLAPVIEDLKEQMKKAQSSLRKVVEASSDLFEDESKFRVGQPDDRGLISRSVASTAVDRLVGLQVVAEEKFGMDENGKVIGLSVQADGAGVRSEVKFPGEDKTRTCFLDVDYSDPRIQRGLHDLEAMDYLTGQIDRHAGNIFIDPQSGKVTGIDNDLSFPDLEREKMFDRNKQLGDKAPAHLPHMMHEETASRIMAITPEALRETLEGIQDPNGQGQLDEYQIGYAVVRLEQLQQAIKDPGSVATGFKVVDKFDAATFQEALAAQDYNGKWSVSCSSYVGTVKCEQLATAQKVAVNSPDHGIIGAKDVGKALRNAEHAEYATQVELAKFMLKTNPAAIADPVQQNLVIGLQKQIADTKEKLGHYERETARLEAEKPGAMLRSLASGGAAGRKEFYSEKEIDALQKLAGLERQLDTALDAAVTVDMRKDLKENATTRIANLTAAREAQETPAAIVSTRPHNQPALRPVLPSETLAQIQASREDALNRIMVKLHQDIDAVSEFVTDQPQYVTGEGQGLTQQLKTFLPAELRNASDNEASQEVQAFISNGPNYQGGKIPINDNTLALRKKIMEAHARLDTASAQVNTLGQNLAVDYSQLDRISVLANRNEEIDRMLESRGELQAQQTALIQQVDALGPLDRVQDNLKPVDQSLQKQLRVVGDQLAALDQVEMEKQNNLQVMDELVTAAAQDIPVDENDLAKRLAVDSVEVDRSYVRMSEADIDAAIKARTQETDFPANEVPEYEAIAGSIQAGIEPNIAKHHKADKAAIEARLIETREIRPLNQRIEAAETKLKELEQAGTPVNDPQLDAQRADLDELYEDLDNWETRLETLKASMRLDDRKNRLEAINAAEKATAAGMVNKAENSSGKVQFNEGTKLNVGNPRQEYELAIAAANAAKKVIGIVPLEGINDSTLKTLIGEGYASAYTYDGPDRFKEDGSFQRVKAANDRGINMPEKERVAAVMKPMIDKVNVLQESITPLVNAQAALAADIRSDLQADPAKIADPKTRQDFLQAQDKLQTAVERVEHCKAQLKNLGPPGPIDQMKARTQHGGVEQAREYYQKEQRTAEQQRSSAEREVNAALDKATDVVLMEDAIGKIQSEEIEKLKAEQNKLLQDFHDQTKAQAATIKPTRVQGASVESAQDKLAKDLRPIEAQIAALDAAETKLQSDVAALEQQLADLKKAKIEELAENPDLIANDDQLRTREELDRAQAKQEAATARLGHCEDQLKNLGSPGVGDRIKAVAQHGGLRQAREHYQNEIQKAEQGKALAGQEIDQLLSPAADRALANDPAAVKLGQDIQMLRQQEAQLRLQNLFPRQALEQQRMGIEDKAIAQNKVRTRDMLNREPTKSALSQDPKKNRVNSGTQQNQEERQERDERLKTGAPKKDTEGPGSNALRNTWKRTAPSVAQPGVKVNL